jgi:hypothetical protein
MPNTLPVTFFVNGINLKTVATTNIIPAMTGKSFTLLRAYVLVSVTTSNPTVSPAVEVRSNAGTLVIAFKTPLLSDVNSANNAIRYLQVGDDSYLWLADLDNPVYFSVTTAATSSGGLTGKVYLEGLITNE